MERVPKHDGRMENRTPNDERSGHPTTVQDAEELTLAIKPPPLTLTSKPKPNPNPRPNPKTTNGDDQTKMTKIFRNTFFFFGARDGPGSSLTVSHALECDSLSSVKPFSPPNTSRRGSALDLFQKGSKSCSDLLELGSVVAVAAEDGPEPFWLGVLEGERPMFGRQNAWLRREGQLGIGVPLRSFLGKIPAAESFARVRPAHPCCSQRCAAGRTRRTHTRTPLDSNWPRS